MYLEKQHSMDGNIFILIVVIFSNVLTWCIIAKLSVVHISGLLIGFTNRERKR